MENVYSKKTRRSKIKELGRPDIKDLAKEFLSKIDKLNQAQKVSLIFKMITNKKPATNLSNDQILNRALYRLKFGKYIKDTNEFLKKKKNKFKWPWKWKNVFKKSLKKRNQILVWVLNIKGVIEPPKLYPLYTSNMVIIRNRPYEVDPRGFWRLGKYTCQIIKEIDRRPVSNLDYNEIRQRGDSTDSDEILIKATMLAAIGAIKKKPVDRKVIVFIVLGILAAIIFFMTR